MPQMGVLSVDYQWEETETKILIRVFLRRVKRAAIDVYITDAYVKVNCAPYLWEADLKNHVEMSTARYGIEESGTVRIALQKATKGLIWHELKYTEADKKTRREASKQRAEEFYNTTLEARAQQKVKEEKRFFNEHWELEKQQRSEIEAKVQAERQAVGDDLASWQGKLDGSAAAGALLQEDLGKEARPARAPQPPQTPGEIFTAADAEADAEASGGKLAYAEQQPEIRQLETTKVQLDFTPASSIYMPQRSRSDEETYRRSRYKPKSLQDTPFYFKERGDKQMKGKDWKGAADSYSEALKRDTCFLSALSNRAVCWLQLHNYRRAIEDCTLALNLLQSTPAANTTGDRFRHGMMKLHARRSAAFCWEGKYEEGLRDMEMAIGYSTGEDVKEKENLMTDLATIKEKMTALGLLTEFEISPLALRKNEADRLVASRDYATAEAIYTEVLAERPDYWDALANRTVVYLCQRRFKEAIRDCDQIIRHCQAVAGALADGGVGEMATVLGDSDDEDDDGTSEESLKRKASNVIKSNTTHVYALLKAFARKGAACAGLKDYRGAYEHMELALRIMPYDNDLRDDVETFRQKLQMNNVVAAATNKREEIQ